MLGWLRSKGKDKPARRAPQPQPPVTAPRQPERDVHAALAEAEERMRRLPPAKAQLIREAMALRRASQSALSQISDEELDKLRRVAEKALLGRGG